MQVVRKSASKGYSSHLLTSRKRVAEIQQSAREELEIPDIVWSDSDSSIYNSSNFPKRKKAKLLKKSAATAKPVQNANEHSNLLQDSFDCLEDTQRLLARSKEQSSSSSPNTLVEKNLLTPPKSNKSDSNFLNLNELFKDATQQSIQTEFERAEFTQIVEEEKENISNGRISKLSTNKSSSAFSQSTPNKSTGNNKDATESIDTYFNNFKEPEPAVSAKKKDADKHLMDFGTTQFENISQIMNEAESKATTKQTKEKQLYERINKEMFGSTQLDNTQFLQHVDEVFKNYETSALQDSFIETKYKHDVSVCFDQLTEGIHDLGTNQDKSLRRSPRKSSIVNLLERTLKSSDVVNKVLQTAEDNIRKGNPDVDWTNDSTVAEAIVNISVEGSSIGNFIKSALLENIRKIAEPQALANCTIKYEDNFTSYGDFYDLPDKVKELIRIYKGIDDLYGWQKECLNLPSVKARKNFIYALPTSGGKTLVAEILLLREILCRKKNVMFVLPYVAIVQEKVSSLSPFAVALDFLVEEYAAGRGVCPPRKRRRKNSVFIATIEKALCLIDSLIDAKRTDELGLVVVDELHLIGDKSRGPSLEALLTKIMFIRDNIQIVGMSATIGNLSEISSFLEAEVYTNNFRPVDLIEYVKCDNEIARVDWTGIEEDVLVFERQVQFPYSDALVKMDPDRLGGLVMEVIPEGSCLVFCSTRKNCENVVLLLCKVISENLRKHKPEEKRQILNALKMEAGSLCHILKTSINFGVAYHHSGLTAEERRIIEDGFKNGVISVICCTSTLAAGVNLPAKRVIIRSPYIGRDFINLSRYKQMIGRAGRAGMGELGESIILCTAQELPTVRKLFASPMDVAMSGMHDNTARGLRHFLLSCISLELATTKVELEEIVRVTLMARQSERLKINVKKLTRAAIKELFKMGALQLDNQDVRTVDAAADVTVNIDATMATPVPDLNTQETTNKKTIVTVNSTSKLIISKMGSAAIKGSLDLERAHILYEDLKQAQWSLVLFTGLHLMYLVTPYDLTEQVNPTKSHYYTLYSKLSPRDMQTAKVLGLTEAVASKMLSNRRITEIPERVLNRFYVTLMLYDLWNERPIHEVAVKYDVNRGLIQNLMVSAATFASNVCSFCEQFEDFWPFALLLRGMSDRLSHCCIRELEPLMKLPSVKQNRAKQLFNAGYKTLQSVAKADPNELINNIQFMSRTLANQLIAAAKMVLLERVENLREEAEDVLEGITF